MNETVYIVKRENKWIGGMAWTSVECAMNWMKSQLDIELQIRRQDRPNIKFEVICHSDGRFGAIQEFCWDDDYDEETDFYVTYYEVCEMKLVSK